MTSLMNTQEKQQLKNLKSEHILKFDTLLYINHI
jgi:hypothetical protein